VVRDDLRYTAEHEWVEVTPEGTLRFGITDFAQEQLGDVVFVSLPDPGRQLDAGAACGEVESTKSVSDIYAPVAGEVVSRNEAVVANPELVNSDPYGAGWMVEVRVADVSVVEGLLDAAAYSALTA
jgi:glycine cleavage system H protein